MLALLFEFTLASLMKTELNGYFSIELYAAMFERENFIKSN